jgi:hypothetical protein
MEGLLQALGSLLRLEAVTIEALLRFEATTVSGFGVLFGVSFHGGHGALLRSVWVLAAEVWASARNTENLHFLFRPISGTTVARTFPASTVLYTSEVEGRRWIFMPSLIR